MPPNTRTAICARVGTGDQTVDPQLRDLREFAKNRGWEGVQEYVDVGVSGAKDSRPGWNELWDAIQKGKVRVLLVHALDRLGRSLAHLVKILSTLVERNVTLISFRENIDLSTSTVGWLPTFSASRVTGHFKTSHHERFKTSQSSLGSSSGFLLR